MFRPIKSPDQGQYVVLLIVTQMLFVLAAVVGAVFYAFFPPEASEQVELLKMYTLISSGAALLIWLGRWVARRLVG